MKKICTSCKKEKQIEDFHKGSYHCKECRKIEYKKNHTKFINTSKEYYANNRKKMKQYYQDNKERIQSVHRKYREENKEKVKLSNLRYRIEQDAFVKKSKRIYKKTLKGKANAIMNQIKRNNQLKNVVYTLTADQWEEIKKLQNYTCLHCGKSEPEIKLTMDHIIPISKRGDHTKENIQGLCRSCNARKLNRIDSRAMQLILTATSL
jgi:5-methylcytosine-specific restriction endonuclease McrA